jgi:hypothetical protein
MHPHFARGDWIPNSHECLVHSLTNLTLVTNYSRGLLLKSKKFELPLFDICDSLGRPFRAFIRP